MLKSAGILLILLSGAGLGYSKSRELTFREKNLRIFLQMLTFLKGEIRCGNLSLPEAFRETAGKLPEMYGELLREIAGRLKNTEGTSAFQRRAGTDQLAGRQAGLSGQGNAA